MKSISPWFQTANLLNGIRKTYSEMQANRAESTEFNRRSGSRDQQFASKKDNTSRPST